jgi:hypothetical protein
MGSIRSSILTFSAIAPPPRLMVSFRCLARSTALLGQRVLRLDRGRNESGDKGVHQKAGNKRDWTLDQNAARLPNSASRPVRGQTPRNEDRCGSRDHRWHHQRVNFTGETMALTKGNAGSSKGKIETVAGNALLDRRALLGRGVALAGALGTGVGLQATGAAAEPPFRCTVEPCPRRSSSGLPATVEIRKERGAQNELIDEKKTVNAQT